MCNPLDPATFATIVIPVCERTTYFSRALDSAIHQTMRVPIVVIDNASDTDYFKKEINRHSLPANSLRYIRFPERLAMAQNWNRCLTIPTTAWVSMLHDDDEIYTNAIEVLHRAVGAKPGCGLFFGLDDAIDERGRIIVKKTETEPLYSGIAPFEYASMNQFCACGFLMRRADAIALGGYSSRLKMTPDWDLYANMCLHYGATKINRVIGRYRVYTDFNRQTIGLIATGRHIRDIRQQQRINLARLGYERDEIPFASTRWIFELAQGTLCTHAWMMSCKTRKLYGAYAVRTPCTIWWARWTQYLPRGGVPIVLWLYSYIRRIGVSIQRCFS